MDSKFIPRKQNIKDCEFIYNSKTEEAGSQSTEKQKKKTDNSLARQI